MTALSLYMGIPYLKRWFYMKKKWPIIFVSICDKLVEEKFILLVRVCNGCE